MRALSPRPATASDLTPRMVELGRALEFWERTNGPQAAMRSILPPERSEELRRAAMELARELSRPGGDGLVLDSDCLQVLARRA